MPPTHEEMLQLLSQVISLTLRCRADAGKEAGLRNVFIGTTTGGTAELRVQRFDAQHLLLIWPPNTLDYQLEATTNLVAPAWSGGFPLVDQMMLGPVKHGLITIDPDSPPRFFRLRRWQP